MKWVIKEKESLVKTKFALLPKRIGDYRIWLHKYYETYDFYHDAVYSGYIPHWFINEDDAMSYVESKHIKDYNFVEWLDAECKKDPDDLCDPPLNPQLAVHFLCSYLLGDDWCIPMSESQVQANSAIVFDILYKYSKKFRKQVKKFRKNNQ
jgi:hypothetical protein